MDRKEIAIIDVLLIKIELSTDFSLRLFDY